MAAVAAVAAQVLTVEEVAAGGLKSRWQALFTDELDNATFDLVNGPLWRLKLLKSTDEAKVHAPCRLLPRSTSFHIPMTVPHSLLA